MDYHYVMMMKHKRLKPGPKPKAPADKQSERVAVNLTPGDHRELARDAEAEGLSLSAFLIRCWRKHREG